MNERRNIIEAKTGQLELNRHDQHDRQVIQRFGCRNLAQDSSNARALLDELASHLANSQGKICSLPSACLVTEIGFEVIFVPVSPPRMDAHDTLSVSIAG